MATANIEESPSLLLVKNIAYFKDTLLQIQCHNFNWEYQKVPRIVANMLIGDLRRILKCAVFLKENRILLLTEELDLHSRYELHENLRRFINVSFECRNFHGDFTIAHVGHYPDLVSIATHVIVDGLDQSVLEEDIVYDFPQFEPDVYKYLSLIPKAHSTPHDRMQELVHAIEGLDLDILQHVVGKAVLKHGLELIPAKPSGMQYHEQREPEHNLTHLDQEGVLQASQVMVQQLVEKGMLKGSVPKLDNFNGDPQFKTVDKTELKSDKKSKIKGAATSLLDADKELTHLEKAWSETANEMKAMQKTLQDITTCIGHLQQNRSPQPISPTNTVDPTNLGNNNQRGRGFYRGRGGRYRGRGQGFYQERPPICWWCKGNVSREEAQHRIQDCPIYKECRENWWKTHPTNSDTTIPSNPEQEEN